MTKKTKLVSKHRARRKGKDVRREDFPPDATFEIMPHDAVPMPWQKKTNSGWSTDWNESYVTIRWGHNK